MDTKYTTVIIVLQLANFGSSTIILSTSNRYSIRATGQSPQYLADFISSKKVSSLLFLVTRYMTYHQRSFKKTEQSSLKIIATLNT